MDNKKYITEEGYFNLTKTLVAKKNKDCRRYLKEQREEILKMVLEDVPTKYQERLIKLLININNTK